MTPPSRLVRLLLASLVGLGLEGPAYTQESSDTAGAPGAPAADPLWKQYFSQFRLRRSTLNKNDIEKPAELQFTLPSGASDFYSIDAGLSIVPKNWDSTRYRIAPIIEYHKRTDPLKEQDNLQVGVTGLLNLGSPVVGSGTSWKPSVVHSFGLALKYADDKQGNGRGANIRLDYDPLYSPWYIGAWRADGAPSPLPDWLVLAWQPQVGLVFQSGDNINKSGSSGEVLRATVGVDLLVYPWAYHIDRRVEFLVSFNYWRDIDQAGAFSGMKEDRRSLMAELNYYFNGQKSAGIGLSYFNGENPEVGLPDQEYLQLGLKLKF